MANSRLFTYYVANTFSDEFWVAAEEYLKQHWNPDEYDFHKIRRSGEPELDDVKVALDEPTLRDTFRIYQIQAV